MLHLISDTSNMRQPEVLTLRLVLHGRGFAMRAGMQTRLNATTATALGRNWP